MVSFVLVLTVLIDLKKQAFTKQITAAIVGEDFFIHRKIGSQVRAFKLINTRSLLGHLERARVGSSSALQGRREMLSSNPTGGLI